MKKYLFFIFILILTLSAFACNTTPQTEGVFRMKEFDKAYITFVFDDGRMPFTKECYDLFLTYEMPICCAVIACKVQKDTELFSVLKDVEKTGGEVLSHTFNHNAFDKNSTVSDFEFQLKDSYEHLTKLGFKINGVIEAGSGGAEKEANYEAMEPVTKKYYKYSNAYGVSEQYNKFRTWFMWNTLDSVKSIIDKAIQEKEWIVFSAHSFDEISKEDMIEVLEYIKSKSEADIDVVTWNFIYENFGEFV